MLVSILCNRNLRTNRVHAPQKLSPNKFRRDLNHAARAPGTAKLPKSKLGEPLQDVAPCLPNSDYNGRPVEAPG